MDPRLKKKLANAKNIEEAKGFLEDYPGFDPERIGDEFCRRVSNRAKILDLEELDSISGGSDRDWQKDGCVATCEQFSWCGSNGQCFIWDVTYDYLWATCPDGHEHVFDGNYSVRFGASGVHPLFKP